MSSTAAVIQSTTLVPPMKPTLRVGIVGFGYWGPNIARNLSSLQHACLGAICDSNPEAQARARRLFPGTTITSDYNDLLRSPEIDAVAVITPVWTHFALAKSALEAGKHVFVEKPFTANTSEAEQLIELAERRNLILMVDHTFLFTGAVKKIRQLIDDGALGDLYYYDSTRVNLGLFQHDVNVVWDLAPHDLSILGHLIKEEPQAIVTTGQRHLNGHEDVAFITIYYPNKIIAHVNVNWLSPVKVRTTLIGGKQRMLVWNDLDPDEKIRVYDKGVKIDDQTGIYDLLVSYRSGDMWAPQVDRSEALTSELSYFGQCIESGETPFNGGQAGLQVVKMLEAATSSLRRNGELTYV